MTKSTVCPHSQRKSNRPGEDVSPVLEVRDDVWHVRSLPVARAILRERGATTQAGFNAEVVSRSKMKRMPMLFADGEGHRQQRTKVARFFTPRTVTREYRNLMEERAEDLVQHMVTRGVIDLADVAMRYSVDVAAEVIGLTNSNRENMNRRLDNFFAMEQVAPDKPLQGRFAKLAVVATGQKNMWAFHFNDVLPAVRARRKQPQDDVISHLIGEGYSDLEIMIEVITFAAAGMVTTREFISMVTWHLLENDELRLDYLSGDETGRFAILSEILRLEPVVGHLYRRVAQDFTVTGPDGEPISFPQGAILDLYLRQANNDIDAEDAHLLCPARPMPKGVGAEAMSFGDGAHKCPGNSLAIQETDILLQRLLRREVTLLSEPRIQWDDLIAGYEVRNLLLKVR